MMDIINRFCELYSTLHHVDPEQLGTIYTQDVEFIDPIASHHGLEAVKAYFHKLLEEAQSCRFTIHEILPSPNNDPDSDIVPCTVVWTMTLTLKSPTKTITLDGVSVIKIRDNKIFYHRDYYDLGEMVYEHIPLLRWVILKIKKRLAS